MRSADMAEAGVAYPPVFVVDGQARYQLPPSPRSRQAGAVQWPLYLLLTLAMCGLAVEACFIYHLYTFTSPPATVSDVGKMGKMSQDRDEAEFQRKINRDPMVKPSKPTAHLTAGPNLPQADGILQWNTEGDAISHELKYENGGLLVQREGFYFVYSKVYFMEPKCDMFTHSVLRRTPRYMGNGWALMESKRFHCQGNKELLSSYLGGIFHLVKGDTVLVKAVNHTLIARQSSSDNFFGMYMI